MRAIQIREHGGPDVLRVYDVPVPEPGPGQVLVKVVAAGVNPLDILIRSGVMAGPARGSLPITPGNEAAGIVERVGPGVSHLAPGQAVLGAALTGGYAEYAVMLAEATWPLPPDFDVAAAGGMHVGLRTAWHGLITLARLQAGEWVLVLGAGGGVGSIAVQIAVAFGARVVAAGADPRKLEAARALGAEVTVDYTQPEWSAEVRQVTGGGAHVIADGVAGPFFAPTAAAAALGARWALYGASGGMEISGGVVGIIGKCITLYGYGSAYDPRIGETHRDIAARAVPLLADGKIRPPVTERLPLADAPEAHRRLAARDVVGKLVLTLE